MNDMWLIIDGHVYNVTGWADDHPGGPEILAGYAGKDASAAFRDVFHSEKAKQMLQKYRIGAQAGYLPPPSVSPSCSSRQHPQPAISPREPVLAQPAFPQQPQVAQPNSPPPRVLAKSVPPPPIHVAQPVAAQQGAEGEGEFKQSITSLADVLVRLLVPVVDGIPSPSGYLVEPTETTRQRLLRTYGEVPLCLQHVKAESKRYLPELQLQQNVLFAVPLVGPVGYCVLPVFVQLREQALIAALQGEDLKQESVRTQIFYTVCTQMATRNIPRAAFTKMGTVVAARVLAQCISSRVGLHMAVGAVNGALPGMYDFVAEGEAQRQWAYWNQLVSALYQPPPVPPYQE